MLAPIEPRLPSVLRARIAARRAPVQRPRARLLWAGAAFGVLLGGPTPADAAPEIRKVTAIIRDFTPEHVDFESTNGSDRGIVTPRLGDDRKPVYAHGDGQSPTTHGRAAFDQWFRDVPGVNQRGEVELEFRRERPEESFRFEDSDFFPIDGALLGNNGLPHNFHFTLEMHTTFVYRGGERFRFAGDDDLFVYVNGRLAIDLGGIHNELSGEIDLDARAGELGLERGQSYRLDLFFAERHTWGSNFKVQTSIDLEQTPEDLEPEMEARPPAMEPPPAAEPGLAPEEEELPLRTLALEEGCGCSSSGAPRGASASVLLGLVALAGRRLCRLSGRGRRG